MCRMKGRVARPTCDEQMRFLARLYPDRRLLRTISEHALDTVVSDRAEVTVLLPRRTFHGLTQRLLHDRTADRIAVAVGRIPHVAATIVPFGATLSEEAIERVDARRLEAAREPALTPPHPPKLIPMITGGSDNGARSNGTVPIGRIAWRQKVTIEGRVKRVQIGTTAGRSLEVQVFDDTGGIRLLFLGRTRIPGLEPGAIVRATGRVGEYQGHLAFANPKYELITRSTD